jgi:hypothetical protein
VSFDKDACHFSERAVSDQTTYHVTYDGSRIDHLCNMMRFYGGDSLRINSFRVCVSLLSYEDPDCAIWLGYNLELSGTAVSNIYIYYLGPRLWLVTCTGCCNHCPSALKTLTLVVTFDRLVLGLSYFMYFPSGKTFLLIPWAWSSDLWPWCWKPLAGPWQSESKSLAGPFLTVRLRKSSGFRRHTSPHSLPSTLTFTSVIGSPIDGISRVVTAAHDRDYFPIDSIHVTLYVTDCIVVFIEMVTPVKSEDVCFICRNSNSRIHNLKSRKAENDDLFSKLSFILGNANLVSNVNKVKTNVCRNCYAKLLNTYDFIHEVRNCAARHVEQGFSIRSKRCLSSPPTPDTTKPVLYTSQSRSRKQLFTKSPSEDNGNAATAPAPSVISDHGYENYS